MPPDSAGKGWDCSGNLSQHISMLLKKVTNKVSKTSPKWSQNRNKIVSKGVFKKQHQNTCEKKTRTSSQSGSEEDSQSRVFFEKNTPFFGHGPQLGPKMVPRGSQDAQNLNLVRFVIYLFMIFA